MKLPYCLFLILFLVPHPAAAGKSSDPYTQGRELYLKGQYPEALKLYQKALKGGKKKWVTLQAIGDAYWAMGQKDEGARYYGLSLKAHPDNPGLKNFLNPSAPSSAAPLARADDFHPSPKILELSITGGKAVPIQTDRYTRDWNMGWEVNLFLGARVSDHLSLGVQADALYPSTHFDYPPPPSTPAGKIYMSNVETFAGNLSLDAHFYPVSAAGDFPVYLVGGGGVYFQRLTGQNGGIYDPSTNTDTLIDFPSINILAPALQWGLGIPIGGPASKLLLECRMIYVFADSPAFYVTFNPGGLIFF